MSIVVRQASAQELAVCQTWEIWESGDIETFEYRYDQDVQFVVQSGSAIIHTQFGDEVHISSGFHVRIKAGVEGRWDIKSPVLNRYIYL